MASPATAYTGHGQTDGISFKWWLRFHFHRLINQILLLLKNSMTVRPYCFNIYYGIIHVNTVLCKYVSTQIASNKMTLYLKANFNNSDSFPAKPTAAAATASVCGEIILPVTPPPVLAARANTGSIPTDPAVTCCNFANNTFDDVSEPVTMPKHSYSLPDNNNS